MDTTQVRAKRTAKLLKVELLLLKKFIKSEGTLFGAAQKIGVTHATVDRVLFKKQGSPDTIEKIRKCLSEFTQSNL